MNWDAIGAVGEIIAAVAVIGTLFFLAIQIRTSNSLAAADSRDKTFEQFSRWRHLVASDPDIARIWRLGCLGEELSDDERLRFDQLAVDVFIICRVMHHRAELSGRKDGTKVAVDTLVRLIKDPDCPALESIWLKFEKDEPFSELVKKVLEERRT
jgi:hypothetical protein